MSLQKLKEIIKEKDVVYGSERTIKNLKLGKTKIVFLASNCPHDVRETIKDYSVEVIELEEPSDELALICKRAHSVIVISK